MKFAPRPHHDLGLHKGHRRQQWQVDFFNFEFLTETHDFKYRDGKKRILDPRPPPSLGCLWVQWVTQCIQNSQDGASGIQSISHSDRICCSSSVRYVIHTSCHTSIISLFTLVPGVTKTWKKDVMLQVISNLVVTDVCCTRPVGWSWTETLERILLLLLPCVANHELFFFSTPPFFWPGKNALPGENYWLPSWR